jgi:hypothetical protein
MTQFRLFPLFSIALVVVGGIAARPNRPATPEVRRIQTHFDSVLLELTAPATGQAHSRDQAAHRAALVQELRAYRDRGVFPHNYDFPDRATPYFVDRKTGTLCAVANLLAVTGRRDIVDRVAAANNNVWVPSLGGDTAFAAWLDQNGLTLAEAARIQVPYMAEPSRAEEVAMYTVGATALGAVAGAVGTGVWNAWGNSDGHRRIGTRLGLTTGLMSAGLGAMLLSTDAPKRIGGGIAGVGMFSTALAVRAMRHRHDSDVAARQSKTVSSSERTVTPGLSVGRDGRTTMSLALRF